MNANQTTNAKSFVSVTPIFISIQNMAITSKQQEEILPWKGRGRGKLERPEAQRSGLATMRNPEKAVTIQNVLHHYQ